MTMSHCIGPFRRFFEITVGHSFFSDTICRQLKWGATTATWQTLENLGMLFRAIAGGMAVYYDTRREQALALLAAQADTNTSGLVFRAYATDPFFKLYTAYPGTGNAHLLYLDTVNTGKDKSGAIRLHSKPFVTDREMIPLAGLQADGILTRRDLGTPPILVARIYPVGGSKSPMDPKGNITEMRYRINFDNRRTYWKYYVLGPLATKSIFVVDPDRQWDFAQASADPIVGDRAAVAFISNAPIPLREVPDTKFQLKLITGKRDKVMIHRLPVAPVNRVHRDPIKLGEAMISEIFIHS